VSGRSILRAGSILTYTMTRPILAEDQIHPAIRSHIAALHADIVQQVQTAIARHPVVVVGMAGNPFPRQARRNSRPPARPEGATTPLPACERGIMDAAALPQIRICGWRGA